MHYGDLSIRANAGSGTNQLPEVTLTASSTRILPGQSVTFTIGVTDPDAASSDSPYQPFEHQVEWFMTGYDSGRATPTYVTDDTQPGWTAKTHPFNTIGVYVVRAEVMDEWMARGWKEVTVTVNSDPVAQNDTATVEAGQSVTIPVMDNDSDPDPGDVLILDKITTAPTKGAATLTAPTVLYAATNNAYSGTDTFKYRIKDSIGSYGTGTVTVTISPDVTRPTVLSYGPTPQAQQIVLVYSERVNKTAAETMANYNLNQGVNLVSAVLAADGQTLTLTTAGMQNNTDYLLTVNNITDTAATPNAILPDTQLSFRKEPGFVYDGFDYPLSDTATTNWVGGMGWKTGSSWKLDGNTTTPPVAGTIVAGLGGGFTNTVLGALRTSGNAVQVSFNSGDSQSLARQIGYSSSGTVWAACLIKPSTNWNAVMRANVRIGGLQAPNYNSVDTAFGVGVSTTAAEVGMGALKNTDANALSKATLLTGSTVLSTNATYLVVAKATGVGSLTGPWAVTKWVLSSNDFSALPALTEAQLDIYSTAKSQNTAATADILTNDWVSILAKSSVTGGSVATVDELRYGNALDDVVVFANAGSVVNQPPVCSITSPATGALLAAPTNVTLIASATDADGTISNVTFYAGPTLLGTLTNTPYSLTWSNVALGAYALTARAVDNSGNVATSGVVNISILQPVEVWRQTMFSTAQLTDPNCSGDLACPAGDGICNLLKYALGLDPFTAVGKGPAQLSTTNGYLTITFTQNNAASDVTLVVEGANALTNGAWSTAGIVEIQRQFNSGSNTWTITDRDGILISAATNRFLRLHVNRP